MVVWLRRLLYALLLLLWLIVIAFPFVAFRLATNGQIQIGGDERRNVRLFLVQEEDLEGVGVEWIRPSRDRENCADGTVSYFFWEGQGDNIRYCQCYDASSGAFLSSSTQSCRVPQT